MKHSSVRVFVLLFASVVFGHLFVMMSGCRPPRPPSPDSPDWVETGTGGDAGFAPPSVDAGTGILYRGTNLSGAEFGSSFPGEPGKDYQYPDPSDVEYFLAAGMNHIRLPFRHERLQPKLEGPLDEEEWSRLAYLVKYSTHRGVAVTLAPFNSFRFRGAPVTNAQIGDFWYRVAQRVKNNSLVSINITNEPYGMTTEMVVSLNRVAVQEIRRAEFKGFILVPGNGYTGGDRWTSSDYGTPNALLMDQVSSDPLVVFEVHQYLDANADGKGSDCVSTSVGVERLREFTEWARSKGRRAWLGEVSAKNTKTCQAAVSNALSYVEKNADVYLGWDWWGAGVWSFATSYPLSIGPANPPKPQLEWLLPFLRRN